jgi:predicted transcriptional regulator/DNA-binding XRE family transcriptional regulator
VGLNFLDRGTGMLRRALTGTRIRERRSMIGLKQADLARKVGISPSYLNLIEHNRRRAGSQLVLQFATALGVAPEALTEGAEAALLEGLRAAATGAAPPLPELDQIEEFAGRFPGWASLLAARHGRVVHLEETVERLTDRMAHDPYLSTSLHEVLSAVSSVRSTAAILAETEDIDPDWRRRFLANLQSDSVRLAESAEAMVAYLDGTAAEDAGLASPQEELEAWLAAQNYHLPMLERAQVPEFEAVIAGAGTLLASTSARAMARDYMDSYRQDARLLPLGLFRAAVADLGPDPAALASRFSVDLPPVMRRLAALPDLEPAVGIVTCDASGTLTFRKPLDGFALPRFGAACPLWPLYQALARPMTPLRNVVDMPGPVAGPRRRFLTYAFCQPTHPGGFDGPTVVESLMLILPAPDAAAGHPIGTGCRVCPRRSCAARREPSIVAEGF